MTIRNVSTVSYPTIAAAMLESIGGDTINLKLGYSNEAATVTAQSMFIDGGASSKNIVLTLGAGIGDVTLLGTGHFSVFDNGGNNVITGNAGFNTFGVTGGTDVVHGGGGSDRLMVDYSGAGGSIIGTVTGFTDGGTNSVVFDGIENFTVRTGVNNDTLTLGDGDNKIKTGGGNDTITTGNGYNNIAAGGGNDTVTSGDGGNNVNGGSGDNTITTGEGKDEIHTGGGNDTVLTGGEDDVTLIAGGLDSVNAGAGRDMLVVRYGEELTNVTGGVSSGDLLGGYTGAFGSVAGDTVTFSNMEDFNVTTGQGADVITTGDGRDYIYTRGGDDVLSAGEGQDSLNGGGGNDTITGGKGGDLLTGEAGSDLFVFLDLTDSRETGIDVITDLRNPDVIDVSAIDADAFAGGNQAFTMVEAFSSTAGEATFTYDSLLDQTFLRLDTNADGIADFELAGAGDLRGYDNFVL
jgi:Ca2+-binding RTX toxin-like protein